MPLYFFDIHDDDDVPDGEGIELSDCREMRGEAIRLAGQILKDLDGELSKNEWSMTVRDETGWILLTLRFSATDHSPRLSQLDP